MSEKELFDLLAGMLYWPNDRHDRLSSPHCFANGGRSELTETRFSGRIAESHIEGATSSSKAR